MTAIAHPLPATGRPTPSARPRHLVSVPTGAAVAAAPAQRQVSITRRGRLAITGALAGLVLATGTWAAWPAGATTGPSTVTVTPGQTLTGIAASELPDVPVDDAVAAIVVANDLPTAHVHAGQDLVIPTR